MLAVKRLLREALLRALEPLTPLGRWLQGGRLAVLCYHDPAPDVLEGHLRALAKHYTFVSLDALLPSRSAPGQSYDRPALAITFDDGWKGNVTLLPVLERCGVPATVFLTTAALGGAFWWMQFDSDEQRWAKSIPDSDRRALVAAAPLCSVRDAMTTAEIRAMAAYVDFGAHTRTHPVLTRCDTETAVLEIFGSKADVRVLTGQPCAFFAYPNGDCSPSVEFLVREAGFWGAFTTSPGFNGPGTPPTRLRRVVVRDDAPAWEAVVRASCLPGLLGRHLSSPVRSALRVG